MGRVGECLVCDWTIIILCDYMTEMLFIVSYGGYFDYYELMQCICTVIRDNLLPFPFIVSVLRHIQLNNILDCSLLTRDRVILILQEI